MYTDQEKRDAMNTCRVNGAVGQNAIVPRLLRDMASKDATVLDYGCGKGRIHVNKLNGEGWYVRGYDFSLPWTGVNLTSAYQWVYASNVLNVQTSESMLRCTLEEIKECLVPDTGKALVNYPGSPRKAGLTVADLESILREHFETVQRVNVKGHVVWTLSN